MQSTPSKSVFALVDGNNFYVSCERVFNPALENRPIVVLSNNDGCAVSRSQQAKDMGIAMGQPWFEMRHLERRGLIALSSNYTLYADMSARMMSLAAQFCPRQEVYSIVIRPYIDTYLRKFNLKLRFINIFLRAYRVIKYRSYTLILILMYDERYLLSTNSYGPDQQCF